MLVRVQPEEPISCFASIRELTLGRSLTRRHPVAIRLALGGSARRVFWQLCVDGILLSLAFAVALPLAWGIIRVVTASLVRPRGPATFPSGTPDAGVIAATALLTVGSGLAIGVVSAWKSVAVRVDEGLRPGRGVIGSLGPFGRGLLVAQVALTMTLLVGAGLFTTTLAHLRAIDTSLRRAATSRGTTAWGNPTLRCSRRPWLARCSRQAPRSVGTSGLPDPNVETSR